MKYSVEHCNTVNEMLMNVFDKYPDNILFKQRDNKTKEIVSYSTDQVKNDLEKLCGWFFKNGIVKKHIAILGENSYEWLLCFFAISCSGNVAVLLDPNADIHELGSLLDFNDCDYLCFSSSYAKKVNDISLSIKKYEMNNLFVLSKTEDNSFDLKEVSVKPNDPAFIVFTSGTSGEKRGVVLSHRNYAFDSYAIAERSKNAGCYVELLPFNHIFSLVTIYCVIIFGGTVFINQTLRNLQKDILDNDPIVIDAVPALLPFVYDALSKMDNSKQRRVFSGGAGGSMRWSQRFKNINVGLYNGYGMTEACGCIALGSELFALDDNYIPILDGLDVYIDEPNENGIGEIMVKGPNIMLEYYKMKEATKEAFNNAYLHTGDLGMMKDDKYITIVGRKKNIIVLPNGENISPELIENKIMTINGVKECIVFEKEGFVQTLIYTEDDRDLILKKIKELNQNLPRNMAIGKTSFTDEPLAKNTTGKIIRKSY